MKRSEYTYNHYLCPSKLMPYIRAVLIYSWYACISFEENHLAPNIGTTEFNSNVPSDVYPAILEKAKQDYIEATGDTSVDNFKEKEEEIDKYFKYCSNVPQDKYPKYTYSCPTKLIKFLKVILTRCWYTCEIKDMDCEADTIIFNSYIPEDIMAFAFERAKMEYISFIHGGGIYVSRQEESRWVWISYMREKYWKTCFYFYPTIWDIIEVRDLKFEIKGE